MSMWKWRISNCSDNSLTSCSNTRCAARSDFSGAVSSRIAWSQVAISRAFERESDAAEQGHVVAELDECVSQIRDNAFGSTVQLRRDGLHRAGYLRDSHWYSCRDLAHVYNGAGPPWFELRSD